jgi:hypothetical protein
VIDHHNSSANYLGDRSLWIHNSMYSIPLVTTKGNGKQNETTNIH